MAEDLEEFSFWLPSEFLSDDLLLMEKEENKRGFENESKVCFPYEFPNGFDSGESTLSSTVESASVVGSTESDEEDYMAGLTRQMAQSMLLDDEKLASPVFWNESYETPKTAKALAGSPQSTLYEVETRFGCSNGSSRASSNSPSQFSSPPTTPMDKKDDAWDLLNAAAGQVVRIKMNNDWLKSSHSRGLLGPPRKQAPVVPLSVPVKTPHARYYSIEDLTHLQMQHNLFQPLKKQQHLQNRARADVVGHGRCGRNLGLSASAWPIPAFQQQQMVSSGMRAVFLEGSGLKRKSVGTGVFLPRRGGNSSPELRKRPASKTVLVPARVVQALNLNLDEMGSTRLRFQEATMAPPPRSNTNTFLYQQKHSIRPHPTTASNYEIRLPQEWTY